MSEKIFVQIASYRDPELLPTLRDCIKRADNPDDLVFCIAWQHSLDDEWDTLEEFVNDKRFKIIDIDYKDSLGTCWARSQTQARYSGEKYTLQLDSHHRFVRGWDTMCKDMISNLQEAGHKKPILTAYLPSYDPSDDPRSRVKEVWKLDFDRFTPEGVIFMLPAILENTEQYELPVSTRFFSAHFLFTLGSWNEEVLYDSNLYFHGEEISLAVRSYTHGYDLFTPHKIVAWHEYTRTNRTKHWDDNRKWDMLNRNSLKRVKCLLNIDDDKEIIEFGSYGFGSQRTKEDYERYAGIRFANRSVQKYTLDNHSAPNPTYATIEAYENSFVKRFKHCIDVHKGSIPEDDYEFWAVIFEDEYGNELYRQDADRNEIEELKKVTGDFYNIWRSYDGERPYKWIVWPYSSEKGWVNRVENLLTRI